MTTALWRIATPNDAGAIHTIREADLYAVCSEWRLTAIHGKFGGA
tara:strand:- start:2 stop:136 length:135 start_codon:yes stop_codon:yes gene_type:complete